MQNCEIICHSEEQSDEESINQQYLFFVCSPGPAAGVALSARAGPGRKVFRIRKRKSLRDMLAIIVILSVSEESMMNAASA